MGSLKYVSMNVNGLQAAAKRRAVFLLIRRGGFDIALLQETYSTEELASTWQREWGGLIYFSNGESNAQGVATLVRKGANIKVKQVKRDEAGQVLSLQIEQDDTQYKRRARWWIGGRLGVNLGDKNVSYLLYRIYEANIWFGLII